MTTPTPHELAAARELAHRLDNLDNYSDEQIASIIAKHRSEEVKELNSKIAELKKLARQACDERYEIEQQATYERSQRKPLCHKKNNSGNQ